ncbi:MAG: hypothetical protein IJ551_09580 [Prevotella sp.]|nr:hypothetical protein [Prevotella sp.]
MKEKKNIAVYYEKPIVRLGDVEPGSYVYNSDAELCYVDEQYWLHCYGIEIGAGKDSIAYPITLETSRIMAKMAAVRKKWHKGNIMNSTFSRELEDDLHELMTIDVYDEDYGKKETAIWQRIEDRYQEMVGHAKALGIFRGQD